MFSAKLGRYYHKKIRSNIENGYLNQQKRKQLPVSGGVHDYFFGYI
jgi:hypothetical protein